MSDAHWLLASDLDGTVIPLNWSADHAAEVLAFRRAVEASDGLVLAYVTGRHLSLALDGIERCGLPPPAILVCDVGTTVHHRHGDDYVGDDAYAAEMRQALGDLGARDLQAALRGIDGLELQEADKQSEYKVSYYLSAETPHAKLVDEVRSTLEEIEARTQLVASVDPADGRGLLDLLPQGVSKGHAVRYLQRHLGLASDHVLYAGDSGNDVDALLAGFNAVVVGNAAPAVVEELRRSAAAAGLEEHLYFATGHCAAGVLEGARHFGMLP